MGIAQDLLSLRSNDLNATHGFADRASHADQLGITNYYRALVSYIRTCETPTTISVEGDWGTGKTTAIEHVIDMLDRVGNVDCVRLDLWSYSGLEQSGSVTASLLQDFCQVLEEHGIIHQKSEEKLRRVVERYGTAVLAIMLGMGRGVDVQGSLDRLKPPTPLADIREFRTELERAIEERAQQRDAYSRNRDGYRLVVVVDDLDRLNPRMAVEILETLKNFADCKRCIFLIAVDFDVVCQGARMKYGELFDDEKAQRFFDKLFQLRFQLPVNEFDTVGYIRSQFLGDSDEDEVRRFAEASSQLMVGGYGNPRNIKRAFNLFHLHRLIDAQNRVRGEKPLDKFSLYVSLLIQMYNSDLYRKLAHSCSTDEGLVGYFEKSRERSDELGDGDAEYLGLVDSLLGLGIYDEKKAQDPEAINRLARCLLSTATMMEATPKTRTGSVGRKPPIGRFRFSQVGIDPDKKEELTFSDDETIVATVESDTTIILDGEELSLSKAAQKLKGVSRPLQGPRFWLYKGERLTDLRERLEEEEAAKAKK